MTLVHDKAQYFWFAFGAWLGAILAIVLASASDTAPREPTHAQVPDEFLIVGYIPLCLLMGLPFFGWIVFRSRRSGQVCRVPWFVPWLLGFAYFPLVMSSIPVLIEITGQGQGARIGSAIFAVLFGLPVAFAEISFRISERFVRPDGPDNR